MPEEEPFAIVMRMAGLRPENLIGYEFHRQRRGGDQSNIDPTRSHLNRRLIGAEDWASIALAEIREMQTENFANELASLKRRRRKTEMERRFAEGPRDPWVASRHGPMREIILTANRKWFEAAGPVGEAKFEELAIGWLVEHFGKDCVHARSDLDEEVYHVHAVIMPRAVAKDGRRLLQPSKHVMIRDYEAAQDSVGDWFAELGLVRGRREAEDIRNAARFNAQIRADAASGVPDVLLPSEVEVPKRRRHVSPRQWREQQEAKIAKRAASVDQKARDLAAEAEVLTGREAAVAEKEKATAHQAQKVATRERAVMADQASIQEGQAKLDRREAGLRAREAEAQRKHDVAGAMIDVAKKVAAGKVEVAEKPNPAMATSNDPVEIARNQAAAIFGRALKAMRLKARDEARVEAEADLSRAFAEIKAADDAIVDITGRLPKDLRAQIAQARKALTTRIMALGQMAKRQFQNRDREHPEK